MDSRCEPSDVITGRPADLLRRVAAHILAEPLRYDQGNWLVPSALSPCGTAGCIAGWLAVLSLSEQPKSRIQRLLAVVFPRWTTKRAIHKIFSKSDIVGFKNVEQTLFDALGPRLYVLTCDTHLFTGDPQQWWPEPFASQWGSAQARWQSRDRHTSLAELREIKREMAKVAAARIEHTIHTGL